MIKTYIKIQDHNLIKDVTTYLISYYKNFGMHSCWTKCNNLTESQNIRTVIHLEITSVFAICVTGKVVSGQDEIDSTKY